jgi:hypothetical protein
LFHFLLFYYFVLFSFFFLLFLFASIFKPKPKTDKEKDKDIPCVMCLFNDDATRNGNKRNDVMKINKKFEEGEGK